MRSRGQPPEVGPAVVPRLHAVTTREILERAGFVDTAQRVLAAGAVALHVRAWGSSGRLLLERAQALREACPDAALLVNDRVDVARIAGTGAHLPEAGLTPVQARTILGSRALIGRSIHDARAFGRPPRAAREGSPDYVFFGHVFETRSKPGQPPCGLDGLAAATHAARARRLPVIAIGGITPERVRSALAAGAHGVAAVDGIWEASDPAAAATRYLAALGDACSSS